MERARGLRVLRLRDCVLEFEELCRPELAGAFTSSQRLAGKLAHVSDFAGLSTLALYVSTIKYPIPSSPLLPFKLSTLMLCGSPLAPSLLTAFFSSPLLTSLSLLPTAETDFSTSVPALTTLFPHLTTLHISHPTPLLPLLPLATSLTHLTLARSIPHPLIQQTLESLAVPLEILGLEDATDSGALELERGIVGLLALKELRVPRRERRAIEHWGAYMHPSELYERGVEVSYVLEW